ncbi:hypothetical protein H9L12_02970 [Sphingomonas rhizophila]|uniref:Uncharacterized protein n=1 Tax=Sphingomonas rhizophila TaxID=2071607 RepID=A0A7G9SCI8_9SPHN|nr:hypothetical protein [Sphingomonas rhizophila]QNN65563.1 hypothetical protein H9L12_02970 [Sphingomonas rhizophila]
MKYDPDEREPLPRYRHPFFISQKREPLPMLFDEDGYPFIQFKPVPQLRRRRVGETAQALRGNAAWKAGEGGMSSGSRRSLPSSPACPPSATPRGLWDERAVAVTE